MIKRAMLVLLAVGCLAAPGFADKGVAMVTRVEGDVTRGGQPVKIMAGVADGDKLHVGAGASVTLMFNDQHKEIIQGDSTFAVATTGSSAPANKKTIVQPQAALKVAGGSVAMLASDQYGGTVKRGGADHSGPTVTSSRYSLSPNPELRWNSVEGAASYTVTVSKDSGDAPIVMQDVSGTSLKVSNALDRGTPYLLKVEAKNADGLAMSDATSDVQVLTDVKVNSLKIARAEYESARIKSPDDASAYLLMAVKYLEAGLTNEAIGVYQELAAKNPTSAYPHERLQGLYNYLGMDREAREQGATAAELNK